MCLFLLELKEGGEMSDVKKYELAERDYKDGMKYADIAKKYGVSLSAVKTWKRRYWSDVATANKKVAKKTKVADRKNDDTQTELTPAEQVFCSCYVEKWNGTQAALKSGIASTKKSAAKKACELLKRPEIQKEIKHLKNVIREGIKVDINDLLKYCLKIIGADIGDYVKWGQREEIVMSSFGPVKVDGKILKKPVNYVDLVDSELVDTSVVSEIKMNKDIASIKLADKKWAWEIVMKYFDLVPNVYQREMDNKRLDIEQEKLNISKIKSVPPPIPAEPLVLQPFYGKPPEDNADNTEGEENGGS